MHDLSESLPVPFDIYTKTSDPFYLFFIKHFELKSLWRTYLDRESFLKLCYIVCLNFHFW